jgi:hypothetical protein
MFAAMIGMPVNVLGECRKVIVLFKSTLARLVSVLRFGFNKTSSKFNFIAGST